MKKTKPFRGRPKGTTKKGLPYLNESQAVAFKEAVRKGKVLRHILMFQLTLFYGLRVTELCRIKVSDIDWDNFGITIRGAKSGRTRTYDKMHPRMWKNLKKWLKEREGLEYAKVNEFLFPSKSLYNRAVVEDGVKYLFKKYAAEAALDSGFSIHSLRHTCGIEHAKAGESPIEIMRWLRHRVLSSTMVYFEQVEFEKQNEKANETFDRLI